MITGYNQINLQDLLEVKFDNETSGEDKAKEIISTFSCPLNPDIENFIHNKAIDFSKQSIAKTHLVFSSYKGSVVLVGYYALAANKGFVVSTKNLSKEKRRRFSKFGTYDKDLKQLFISAPLIAQLGKNYTNGYNKLISGADLLKLACDKIEIFQREIGGKIIYLECEDNAKLVQFYEDNGFECIGKREREQNEIDLIKEKYLLQMFKYRKG